MSNSIYTIGHSTRSWEEFHQLLKINSIEVLADVRSFPGSRKFPHFNKEFLAGNLSANDIRYIHFPDLGGRRKKDPASINTAWRHDAFRGYADYMSTENFKTSITELMEVAKGSKTAFMCSEAVWWRCHRRLIADWLVSNGWTVLHILSKTKVDQHKLNDAAVFKQGNLFYP